MKKTLIILTICLIALFSWCLIGYSETGTEEENLSLAKAIQSELPGVFDNNPAFLATGFNFIANVPSLLDGAGVVSSNDLALNQLSSPPVSGGSGSGGFGKKPTITSNVSPLSLSTSAVQPSQAPVLAK